MSGSICTILRSSSEGMPSGTATHVEQQVARLHAEPVEADREHYLASISRRMRYCSTVFTAVCLHDQWSTTR